MNWRDGSHLESVKQRNKEFMRTTVIMHFYNEEFLLPWWLKHHVQLFDHGILIDYASTDRSVQICRELAPTWEIRPSANAQFDARLVDEEVMEIERGIEGWKLVLNVTEFFVCRDMELFKWAAHSSGASAFAIRAALMIDPADVNFPSLDETRPLVSQRHYGYFEDEGLTSPTQLLHRNRIFHRRPDGRYKPGRHLSEHPTFKYPPGALILWFGYSPWIPQIKNRMLQIQTRIPESDKKLCNQNF